MRCDGTISLQFHCLMCNLCLWNDLRMCHAILDSTFRSKATSQFKTTCTSPNGGCICEVLLYIICSLAHTHTYVCTWGAVLGQHMF